MNEGVGGLTPKGKLPIRYIKSAKCTSSNYYNPFATNPYLFRLCKTYGFLSAFSSFEKCSG